MSMPGDKTLPQPVEHFPALALEAREEEVPLTGLLVRDQDLTGADLSGLELRSVTFEHCRFPGCDWWGASFTDVSSHTCDLSGGRRVGPWWPRFSLTDCRGLGMRLPRARMRQGSIMGCRLSEAQFGGGKLRETHFSDCDLTGAAFSECVFQKVELTRCDLTRASFVHTLLKGVDLTTCAIDALVLSEGCPELQGAVVDLWQAAGLARRLGVIVKE